jgi:hypothetical protein
MRILLVVTGLLNLVFMAFHIMMFFGIAHAPSVTEAMRMTMYTFNVVAVLATAFLGYALLVHRTDIMTTGLGAATLAFGALLYLTRAARDVVFMTGEWKIAGVCALVGLLHVVLLFGVRLKPSPAA